MGSVIEINDTLQLTNEQGFPAELVYEQHKNKPFTAQEQAFDLMDRRPDKNFFI